MCGRYASYLPPEAIAALFGATNPLPNLGASWNVAPSQDALVVRRHPETGQRHLDVLRWGLVPHWQKEPQRGKPPPINARAEGLASSPMFKGAFVSRRCLVPVSAFYEWRRGGAASKQPYAVARRDEQPMALAGLWESRKSPAGEVLRTFAIITTDADGVMAPIHIRMPVVVEEADWPVWLGEVAGDYAALLRPAADDMLKTWPVSPRVNSPRNNGPDLLEPATAG